MFNPQFEFGSKIEFEGETFDITQRKVTVLNSNPPKVNVPFLELAKNDIFTAQDEEGSLMADEQGNIHFLANSDPYRDELGIPCIDICPYQWTL